MVVILIELNDVCCYGSVSWGVGARIWTPPQSEPSRDTCCTAGGIFCPLR